MSPKDNFICKAVSWDDIERLPLSIDKEAIITELVSEPGPRCGPLMQTDYESPCQMARRWPWDKDKSQNTSPLGKTPRWCDAWRPQKGLVVQIPFIYLEPKCCYHWLKIIKQKLVKGESQVYFDKHCNIIKKHWTNSYQTFGTEQQHAIGEEQPPYNSSNET